VLWFSQVTSERAVSIVTSDKITNPGVVKIPNRHRDELIIYTDGE